MLTEDKVTELFCMADDFCKFFDAMLEKYTLKSYKKRRYHRDSTMSKAEIILIMILFHDSGYRCLKHFYLEKVSKQLRHLFPKVVSYNRFVELEKEVAVPLALFIKKVLLGKCTGISFVDSTPLRVCRNQRIGIHKVFKGIAQRGKCSMGWFFGFKLHLICNEKGELLNFMITPGDVDDRKPLEYKAFIEFIYGKLVADKGYIGKNLFQRLFVDGIQLITKLKSNMKGALMSVSDKLLLRKRAIIETECQRDRSVASAYQTALKKKDDLAIALALSPFARKTAELVNSGAYEAAAGSCYAIFRCLAKTCKEHEDWYAGFTGYGDTYTKLAIFTEAVVELYCHLRQKTDLSKRMADEMDINLEVFNLETDFFGDLHCSSRFTDMLCDAHAQYQDYSELDKCPMWRMWMKEGGE